MLKIFFNNSLILTILYLFDFLLALNDKINLHTKCVELNFIQNLILHIWYVNLVLLLMKLNGPNFYVNQKQSLSFHFTLSEEIIKH